jgi:hypothetical protein
MHELPFEGPVPPHIQEMLDRWNTDPKTRAFQEGAEDGSIWTSLPFSTFGEWIKEEDYLDEGERALPVGRLTNVSTLGFLVDTRYKIRLQYYLPFHQGRHEHDLGVAAVAGKVAAANGASKDIIRKVSIAGLMHDQATPAGGDATKWLDPVSLHEEDHWKDVLGESGNAYLDRYGIDRNEMDKVIHGKGVLGEILDIADRVTYTMIDLFNTGTGPTREIPQQLRRRNKKLNDLVQEDPLVGDIFRTVRVNWETGQVYFTDPNKLRIFLEIRARMHQYVYLNRESQGRDMLFTEMLKPFYSVVPQEGKLTPDQLRIMTDNQLFEFISAQYNFPKKYQDYFGNHFELFMTTWRPLYIQAASLEETALIKEKLEQDPRIKVVGIKHIRGFNPGTSYNIIDTNGNIVPFSEFDPKNTAKLEAMGRSTEGFVVYFGKASEMPNLKAT